MSTCTESYLGLVANFSDGFFMFYIFINTAYL